MRKANLIAVLLLTSCADTQAEGEWAPLFLDCVGTGSTSGDKEQRYLLQIGPDHGEGRSLLFYDDQEMRFEPSGCFTNFTKCHLFIGEDRITESGIMVGDDNKVLMSAQIDINRRTGTFRQTLFTAELGEKVALEGRCTQGEAPKETPTQF